MELIHFNPLHFNLILPITNHLFFFNKFIIFDSYLFLQSHHLHLQSAYILFKSLALIFTQFEHSLLNL